VPHLVASLIPASGDSTGLSLARCHALLRDAHDYLARRGMEAARRATLVDDASAWGGTFKRVRVALPSEGRPAIVRDDGEAHSLAEVVNQCATMERLLDALSWAQTPASGMSSWTVALCHPTTSSTPGDGSVADYDLVLRGPDGEAAWFEVSDVASTSDGNRKEERDLRSLGVLREGKGAERFELPWPKARVFLVVSTEFAGRLRTRRWQAFHYVPFAASPNTVVAEVRPGLATAPRSWPGMTP
jgi:hypothetical protein